MPKADALLLTLNLFLSDPASYCLTATVYGEARGEPEQGMALVAKTILNRTNSKEYPDTVCEVVQQPRQFAGYGAALPRTARQLERWEKIAELVVDVQSGKYELGNCGKATHFDMSSARPYWADKLTTLCRVGNHTFYR